MSLNKIPQLVKEELIKLGWFYTEQENIITKNDCYLNLTGGTYKVKPINAFTYTEAEIKEIIRNDYNVALPQKALCAKDSFIDLSNQQYYMEKYGWLLCKGRYNSGMAYADYNNPDDKNLQMLINFVEEIDAIANRDYLMLRGVKQSLRPITRKESVFKPIPSSKPFDINSIIQIKETSTRCDLFKQDALFKVNFILEDIIVVTIITSKGMETSKHYELDLAVVMAEIKDNNVQLVELTPATVDTEDLVWLPFNDIDVAVNLPAQVEAYVNNDKQKVAIMECFSKYLNFSVLLNKNISEFAYPVIIDMLENNFLIDEMFTQKIRETNAVILNKYVNMGLNPERFFDDTIDSLTLEDLLREALLEADNYKAELNKLNLNEDVIEFLYHYRFARDAVLDVMCDESTRWQFLLPYLYDRYFDIELIKKFEQLIKMYAIMSLNGCSLKATFLDAQTKGALLNYFKVPQAVELLGKRWEDLLLDLLNKDTMIEFTEKGIKIKGSIYSIARDINSIAILDLVGKAVWRCVFINEEKIIMHNGSDIYF